MAVVQFDGNQKDTSNVTGLPVRLLLLLFLLILLSLLLLLMAVLCWVVRSSLALSVFVFNLRRIELIDFQFSCLYSAC